MSVVYHLWWWCYRKSSHAQPEVTCTVGTFSKSNQKIVERGQIDTPCTHIHDRSISWLYYGTDHCAWPIGTPEVTWTPKGFPLGARKRNRKLGVSPTMVRKKRGNWLRMRRTYFRSCHLQFLHYVIVFKTNVLLPPSDIYDRSRFWLSCLGPLI
jgi:hypothetical protein